MKTVITPAYVFTPSAGTLDLSSITNFSIKRLYAVLNVTRGAIIFAQGDPTTGYSALNGAVLTLTTTVSSMNSADALTIIYDVSGATVAANSSPVTLASDDTTALAIGTIADSVWSGTGSSSVVAALKAIWAAVTGTLKIGQPDVRATGTLALATINATYSVAITAGEGAVGFSIVGLAAGAATLIPEVSNDGGTTWNTTNAALPGGLGLSQAITTDGNIKVNAGGHTNVRLRVSVVGTGTATVASNAVIGNPLVSLSGPLPTGTNTIGAVTYSGNIGTDRSSNIPTGPGSATSFTYNGTVLNLLSTFPVNPNRKNIEINNTTGSLIVLVIDDGNNTTANTSLYPFTATTAFNQGGSWTSSTEQGRVRIFGTSGTFCYGREN